LDGTRTPENGKEEKASRTAGCPSDQCGQPVPLPPHTEEAKQWIADNVDPDSQWFAGGLVVETRFAQDLAKGMQDAGLTVK